MMAQREQVSQHQLIAKFKHTETLTHLAKTPIVDKTHHLITKHKQLYSWGFNSGGRPEGFWVSFGTDWLEATIGIGNPRFPPCCYLYEVSLKPRAKVLRIKTKADFKKFDKSTPDYWLNFDYFDIDYVDYLTGERIFAARKYPLIFDKLQKKPKDTIRTILINNKVIFTSAAEAKKHCEFYNQITMPIERFKYKDWGEFCKKYDGIIFEVYDKKDKDWMQYIWYQSLDIASGCVWNPDVVDKVALMYVKKDHNTWEKVE